MAMTLITTNTSSGASASEFTSGIDSTYKLYIFKYYDVNTASTNENLQFQGNASGQSGFNETITTTMFNCYHGESNSPATLAYNTGNDRAQSTSKQALAVEVGGGADESCAGTLWLFNPSNTTYVKHFYSTANGYHQSDQSWNTFVGGYFNTTAAITEIHFNCGSDFDAVIKMYGVG